VQSRESVFFILINYTGEDGQRGELDSQRKTQERFHF